MLDLLAQATYSYNYTTTTTNAPTGVLALFSGVFLIVWLALLAVAIVSMWKLFVKAGQEGWKSIIPVYNTWVLCEIAGKPGWWALISLGIIIPLLGIFVGIAAFVLFVIVDIELAKSFGKDPIFALLLILLPIVGYPILAFGDAKYVGPGGKGGGAKPAAPKSSAPAAS